MSGRLRLSVLAVVLLLVSCERVVPTRQAPGPTPAIDLAYPAVAMTSGNVKKIKEFADLRSEGSGPVVALAFTPDGQHLLAAYQSDHMLRRWQVNTGDLQATWQMSVAEPSLISFDASTRLVASRSRDGHDVSVWNTETGEIISELKPSDEVSAVALSPDGRTVFVGMTGSYGLYEVAAGKPNAFVILSTEPDGARVTSLVSTFDSTGEWLVIAQDYEWMTLQAVEHDGASFGLSFLWGPAVIEGWQTAKPLAVALDPTRRWLAAVIGSSLQMWDTSIFPVPFGRTRWNIGTGESASLDFSPDGKLLALGTEENWQVWSVPRFKRLVSQTGYSVYALAFSPDGRLLAWGDQDGVVHLWGVESK